MDMTSIDTPGMFQMIRETMNRTAAGDDRDVRDGINQIYGYGGTDGLFIALVSWSTWAFGDSVPEWESLTAGHRDTGEQIPLLDAAGMRWATTFITLVVAEGNFPEARDMVLALPPPELNSGRCQAVLQLCAALIRQRHDMKHQYPEGG